MDVIGRDLMSSITFVIGATASGKSFYINEMFSQEDVDILNAYDYQQRAYDEAGYEDAIPISVQKKCVMKANSMLLEDILRDVKAGKKVVVEQTFYKAKRRIAYIDEIRKCGDVTIDVHVMCPDDDRWKMNIQKRGLDDRFEYYKAIETEIEFPNPSEGFDNIFAVKNGKPVLRMDDPKPEIVDIARKELQKEAEMIKAEDARREEKEKLIESMKKRPFWHYCEVCGKKEYITAEQAYMSGWDYPPHIGMFGVLSPRTCGNCSDMDTLWAKFIAKDESNCFTTSELNESERKTLQRIKGEPESLLTEDAWDL